MAEATLKNGSPLMADYTPGSAVAAGQVVVLSTLVAIATRIIAAGELGALAVCGGIYTTTADGALAAGDIVYWDDTANKVTATSTSNKKFGKVAPGSSSAADGDSIDVIHFPNS